MDGDTTNRSAGIWPREDVVNAFFVRRTIRDKVERTRCASLGVGKNVLIRASLLWLENFSKEVPLQSFLRGAGRMPPPA